MIAHGATFVGWMLEYESIADPKKQVDIWNEAVDRSQQTETKVLETTYRLLSVHPDDARDKCPMCPKAHIPAQVREVPPPPPPPDDRPA